MIAGEGSYSSSGAASSVTQTWAAMENYIEYEDEDVELRKVIR